MKIAIKRKRIICQIE